MPRRSFRRYLKSNLIRIIAASALMILAAVFATAPYRDGGSREPSGAAHAATTGQKPKESFWQRTADDPVATFTAVLAAFTLALVCVSVVQIYFLTRADSTARISANATKTVAEATRTSADHLVSIERPFLYIEDIDITLGSHMLTTCRIANMGRTPAILNRSAVGIRIFDELPDIPPINAIKEWRDKVVYSKETTDKLYLSLPVDDRVKTPWRENGLRLFISGYMIYGDVFSKTRETGFAYEVVPAGLAGLTFGKRGGAIYNYDREI